MSATPAPRGGPSRPRPVARGGAAPARPAARGAPPLDRPAPGGGSPRPGPASRVGSPLAYRVRADDDALRGPDRVVTTREGSAAFVSRQFVLLAALIAALIVGQTASAIFRGLTFPLLLPVFPYLGYSLLLAVVLVGGVGVLTVLRGKDSGWPTFLAMVGLWIFVFSIEDAILQWFTFQLGFGLSGGRINVVQIGAFMLALGLAVLLHMNQVGRRLHGYFAERGVDREELVGVEAHVRANAHRVVWPLVGVTAGSSLVLLVGEQVLGRARLGVGALGIMGGLVVVLVLATLVFRALAEGPQGIGRPEDVRDSGEASVPRTKR